MKSFIIHLPKMPESIKTATELRDSLEDFNMEAELFEGTMGPDAIEKFKKEGRTVHPFGLKGKLDPNGKEASKMSTPGVMGCFDSHYSLWKKCVEMNEPIFIWEDDIMLTRKYYPIDWDDVLIVALGHPRKSPEFRHLLDEPTGEPTALEYKRPSMPGCCGYALKPHAAQKLVSVYANTFRPADNAINRTIVKMQIHSYIMGIARVEGKKSLTRPNAWRGYK